MITTVIRIVKDKPAPIIEDIRVTLSDLTLDESISDFLLFRFEIQAVATVAIAAIAATTTGTSVSILTDVSPTTTEC